MKPFLTLLLFFFISKFGISQILTVWQTTFENSYAFLTYEPQINNIWQVGSTNKLFFGSAESLPNAIMTDTVNPYPINCNSSFVMRVHDPWGWFQGSPMSLYLSFDHKFQTNGNKDGGIIEVSYDSLIWYNVLDDPYFSSHSECMLGNSPQVNNFYSLTDTITNNQFGFNGISNGWIQSSIYWCWFMAASPQGSFMPDSMWIRFRFISDSVFDNLDGWIVDNIHLEGEDYTSIEDLITSNTEFIFPNPSCSIFKIEIPKQFGEVKTIEIYSSVGNLLFVSKDTMFDLSHFENGIYFIIATSVTGEKISAKAVKQ